MEPAPQAVLDSFAEAVRETRARRRVSQEALAEQADLSRNFIGLVERGETNPSLTSIVKLAGALGVTTSDLVRHFEQRLDERRS